MISRLLCAAKTNILYTVDLKNEKNNADKCVWYASICVKKKKKHLLVIYKTFLYDFTRNW